MAAIYILHKDSQFSVPIKAPVGDLTGREAPGNFFLLWGSIYGNMKHSEGSLEKFSEKILEKT